MVLAESVLTKAKGWQHNKNFFLEVTKGFSTSGAMHINVRLLPYMYGHNHLGVVTAAYMYGVDPQRFDTTLVKVSALS